MLIIISRYSPNNRAPKLYEANSDGFEGRNISTIIVGVFNTPFSVIHRTFRYKINKEIENLNNIINQPDLTDTHGTLYPKIMDYTFFSSTHGKFSRIGYMLGDRMNLRVKNIEILQSIFSDDNGMILEIHNRRKTRKFTNSGIKNTLLTGESRKK